MACALSEGGRVDVILTPILLALDDRAPSADVWRQMAQCGEPRALRVLIGHLRGDPAAEMAVRIGELSYEVHRQLAAAYQLASVGSRAGSSQLLVGLTGEEPEERVVSSHAVARLALAEHRAALATAAVSDSFIEVRIFAAVGLAKLGDPTKISRAIPEDAAQRFEQMYGGDPMVVSAQVTAIGDFDQATLDGIDDVLASESLDSWWGAVLGQAVSDMRHELGRGEP